MQSYRGFNKSQKPEKTLGFRRSPLNFPEKSVKFPEKSVKFPEKSVEMDQFSGENDQKKLNPILLPEEMHRPLNHAMDFALSPTNMNTRTDRLDRRRGGKHGHPGTMKKWNKENAHKTMLKSLWKNRRENKFDAYHMTDFDFNGKPPEVIPEEPVAIVEENPEMTTDAMWNKHLAHLKRLTALLVGTRYNGWAPSYCEMVIGKQVLTTPTSFARSLTHEFEDEKNFPESPRGVKRKFAEVC